MNLHATILGLLSWKPSSGYDLKQIISDSDIFYWSGNNNQIYKCLLELQNDGLVTHEVQAQTHLPAKKVYSITDKGLAELSKRLLEEPSVPELHKDFLIQLAWAEALSDEQVLALLEKYEEEIASRLIMVRSSLPGDHPQRSKREAYLWKRVAQNLVDSFQTELDWAHKTRIEFMEKKYLTE